MSLVGQLKASLSLPESIDCKTFWWIRGVHLRQKTYPGSIPLTFRLRPRPAARRHPPPPFATHHL